MPEALAKREAALAGVGRTTQSEEIEPAAVKRSSSEEYDPPAKRLAKQSAPQKPRARHGLAKVSVLALFAEDTPRAGWSLLESDLKEVSFDRIVNPTREQLNPHGFDEDVCPDGQVGCYVITRGDEPAFTLVGTLHELRHHLYATVQSMPYGKQT